MELRPVWVVGEALVDQFATRAIPGGAPFNVARTLSGLGVPVRFISRIGKDAMAEVVLVSAARYGLTMDHVQMDQLHPTGVVRVIQESTQHRFEIAAESAWDFMESGPAEVALKYEKPSMVYFGTLAQRHQVSRTTIRNLISASNALCYLDLNLRQGLDSQLLAEQSLHLADWVKVNDEELDQILLWFGDAGIDSGNWREGYGLDAIALLMHKFSLTRLVVTLGAKGALCFDNTGKCLAKISGNPGVRVVDTVGAGDGFSAVLIASLTRGHDLPGALSLANSFGAEVCTHEGPLRDDPGALIPWRARIEALGLNATAIA
jgi:fructokinase